MLLLYTGLLLLLLGAIAGNDFSHVGSAELKQFKQCVRGASGQRPRLSECLGRSALNFIQRVEESDNVSFVEDFASVKSDTAASRSLANVLDTDPVDFRGILENAGAVMGQRSLEWHMDGLYPGLMFKIGPTTDANSVAEFVLDGAGVQGERQFGYEDPSAGRLLAKQYLLPFLLGLKFNLVALVPLLFAGICLLLKKSLFLVKLAVYVSSFLGLGGVVSSLGGLGGGLSGGLGGFGGFGGGSSFGFQGHRPVGHFPGKTTVFGHGDELHHQQQQQYDVHEASPYRRSERKVRFEQPRAAAETTEKPQAPTEDRFYDFEQQRRASNKLLEQEDTLMRSNFQAGMQGWQAVDCLGAESERMLELAARDNSSWQINEYLSIEPPVEEVQARSLESGVASRLLQLLQGRALRVQLPRQLTIANGIDEAALGTDQGRKKKDKDKHMAMMGGMIMMATVAQMFLGKVILIAGSAFIMAKIALVISLLGSLKKGSAGHSGSSGGGPEHVIVTSTGSSSGHSHESGWHRSMPTHEYSGSQLEEPTYAHAHDRGYYAYEMDTLNRRQFQPQPEAEAEAARGFV
ncbi:uncharacterized protein DMAD_10912 [Drosophila madeirensis]|uniref:Protein osiris 10 n=1 Tax=Drosophila madeirensis TaxID=30013 RepID=A0AAU9FB96_DROMD